MNVLMLSLMYPQDQMDEVSRNAKDKLQNQINNYQRAFVEGIESNLLPDEKLDIFNCLPVGIYPLQYKQLFLKHGVHDSGRIYQSGCINFPFLKQYGRFFSAVRYIEKWLRKDPSNRTVLVYTQYLPYMRALSLLKKRYKDLKAAVIVTDLPNELGLSSGRTGMLRKIEYRMGSQSLDLLRQMDGFILLTEPMADALQVREKPFTVIEGLILSNKQASDTEQESQHIFLYSGTLERDLGIVEMLDAFSEMPECQLWICGHGNMKNEVEQYAKRYSNIRYFGFVSQKEALALQANATALINPRQADGLFTRYSFPSKTLEYMRSGKPVLCCKLEGIPGDYDSYLSYMDAGKDGIMKAARQLMLLTPQERYEKGCAAREYVLHSKNPAVQCRKLLDLLRSL